MTTQAAINRGVFVGTSEGLVYQPQLPYLRKAITTAVDQSAEFDKRWPDGPLLGPAYGVPLTDPVQPMPKPFEYPPPYTPDLINHPPHYTALPGGVEVIDITETLNFRLGNTVKYILRADLKGHPMDDLRKAQWYLNREIAKREAAG